MLLREKLGYTEVKGGGGKGDCGACASPPNGKAANACLTLALQAHKQKLVTLKGIGTPARPSSSSGEFCEARGDSMRFLHCWDDCLCKGFSR